MALIGLNNNLSEVYNFADWQVFHNLHFQKEGILWGLEVRANDSGNDNYVTVSKGAFVINLDGDMVVCYLKEDQLIQIVDGTGADVLTSNNYVLLYLRIETATDTTKYIDTINFSIIETNDTTTGEENPFNGVPEFFPSGDIAIPLAMINSDLDEVISDSEIDVTSPIASDSFATSDVREMRARRIGMFTPPSGEHDAGTNSINYFPNEVSGMVSLYWSANEDLVHGTFVESRPTELDFFVLGDRNNVTYSYNEMNDTFLIELFGGFWYKIIYHFYFNHDASDLQRLGMNLNMKFGNIFEATYNPLFADREVLNDWVYTLNDNASSDRGRMVIDGESDVFYLPPGSGVWYPDLQFYTHDGGDGGDSFLVGGKDTAYIQVICMGQEDGVF